MIKPGACNGNQRLRREAFLSMIGSSKISRPVLDATIDEQQMAVLRKYVADAGGNVALAAARLGITPASLKRKLYRKDVTVLASDEVASTNPARRYFENLQVPWSVTNFDPSTGEVCTEIRSKSGTVRLSTTVRLFK